MAPFTVNVVKSPSLSVTQMGSQLVLLSPCLRKMCLSLCKMKNVFFSMVPIWKKMVIFDLLFTFSGYQGKASKIPLAHNYLAYIHKHIFLTLLAILPSKFWKKLGIHIYDFFLVWHLALICIPAVLEQSINEKKMACNLSYWYLYQLN